MFEKDGYMNMSEDQLEKLILDVTNHELLMESIKNQLRGGYKSNINQLEVYLDNIDNLLEGIEDNDIVRRIDDLKEQTILKVIKYIKKKFQFDIYTDDLDVCNIAGTLYDFFIFNNRENIINFYINYINNNKKSLIKHLENNNDIELAVNKKLIKNTTNALIISKMYEIINIVKNADIGNEDFLRTIIGRNDDYACTQISKLLDADRFSFEENIKDSYLKYILKDEYEMMSLTSDINSQLISEII